MRNIGNLFPLPRYSSLKGKHNPEQLMTNSMSDEELMAQVRGGVGEMLGALFERYHVALFNFFYKLTGERSTSEDLVQEVFLRILKYRHSYRPDTPFRSWLYQIARNARVDLLRRRRPEVSWEPEMSGSFQPGDLAQQNQEAALLHAALLRLPEEKREVLVLSRFQDLKYEQIAEILGCELSTVKVKVHRALQELRDIFQKIEAGKLAPKPRPQGPGMWPGSGSLQ
jgi:RNA polymerase sigma-70 factor (ECF subfamily)